MILDSYWELIEQDFDEHIYLVNGQAHAEVETFLSKEHTFEEYKECVVKYHQIGLDLSIKTSTEILFGNFKVHCGGAIMAFCDGAEKLKNMVVGRMTQIYLEIGKK